MSIYVINEKFLSSKLHELNNNISGASISLAIVAQKIDNVSQLTDMTDVPFNVYKICNHDTICIQITYNFEHNPNNKKAVAIYKIALEKSLKTDVQQLINTAFLGLEKIKFQEQLRTFDNDGSPTSDTVLEKAMKQGCDQQAVIGAFLAVIDSMKLLIQCVNEPSFTELFKIVVFNKTTKEITETTNFFDFSKTAEDIFEDIGYEGTNQPQWMCNDMNVNNDPNTQDNAVDKECEGDCLPIIKAKAEYYMEFIKRAPQFLTVSDINLVLKSF